MDFWRVAMDSWEVFKDGLVWFRWIYGALMIGGICGDGITYGCLFIDARVKANQSYKTWCLKQGFVLIYGIVDMI